MSGEARFSVFRTKYFLRWGSKRKVLVADFRETSSKETLENVKLSCPSVALFLRLVFVRWGFRGRGSSLVPLPCYLSQSLSRSLSLSFGLIFLSLFRSESPSVPCCERARPSLVLSAFSADVVGLFFLSLVPFWQCQKRKLINTTRGQVWIWWESITWEEWEEGHAIKL